MKYLNIETFVDEVGFPELDAVVLSEVLWLAKYMKPSKQLHATQKKQTSSTSTIISDEDGSSDSGNKDTTPPPPPKEEFSPPPQEEEGQDIPLSIGQENQTSSPITISHKGYFEDSQNLSKYLIHFKEKKLSRKKRNFDEEKTVDYVAHTGITLPFFQAKKQKRYTLMLFVDCGESMQVWSEMIATYEKLLIHSGVFRAIQTVYIDSNNTQTLFVTTHPY